MPRPFGLSCRTLAPGRARCSRTTTGIQSGCAAACRECGAPLEPAMHLSPSAALPGSTALPRRCTVSRASRGRASTSLRRCARSRACQQASSEWRSKGSRLLRMLPVNKTGTCARSPGQPRAGRPGHVLGGDVRRAQPGPGRRCSWRSMPARLGDDGHGAAQLVEAQAGDVHAVDHDGAAAELLEAEQAVHQGRLACARPAHLQRGPCSARPCCLRPAAPVVTRFSPVWQTSMLAALSTLSSWGWAHHATARPGRHGDGEAVQDHRQPFPVPHLHVPEVDLRPGGGLSCLPARWRFCAGPLESRGCQCSACKASRRPGKGAPGARLPGQCSAARSAPAQAAQQPTWPLCGQPCG